MERADNGYVPNVRKGMVINMIRVTVWNEHYHEQNDAMVRIIYQQGIQGCIAKGLRADKDLKVQTATFEMREHGLTEEVLENTDVLIFWSHVKHAEFSDEVAERIKRHVLNGMGFIPLHSAHDSKPVKLLLGTSMTLTYKHGDREKLFCTAPTHPIAAGLPACIELPTEEMYGEYFDIPKPDDVVFTGWFAGGEVFRSGCTFTRGYGKIFYFQPGHQDYPTYYIPEVQQILRNAVHFCAPVVRKTGELSNTQVN